MPLPPHCRVRSCMGCIPLQQGCIILGCIGLVGSLLEFVTHVRILVDFELSVNQCRQKEISSESDDPPEIVPDDRSKCPNDNIVNLARFVLGVSSFTYVIYFIMTAMMIYGVRKKIPKMMTPWIVWEVVQIFFNILILLGLDYGRVSLGASSLFEVILMIYFIVVVTSYYLELKEAEERHGGIRVVAVTQTPHEMTVVIPTPTAHPKEDPPPPYPGFTCAANPGYDPTGTGMPLYSQNIPSVAPPQYQEIYTPPPHLQTSNVPIPNSQAMSTNLNTPLNVPAGHGEAAPLVEKPPLPNN